MTKSATAYLYEELSDDAQKKALDKCRNWFTEGYDWWEYVYEWYQNEILPKEGFEVKTDQDDDPKMFFSGFWNQGDGASFEAGVDVRQFLLANKLAGKFRSLYYWSGPEFGYAYANISTCGRYSHEMTMNIEVEWEGDWDENAENVPAVDQLEELESMILSRARDMARKLYKSLEKEYEGMTTDEYVSDSIEANEYYFWSNGSPATVAAFQ